MAGNQQLFRQKSLDGVDTPESLNEYLKVTSPGVWLLLGAIVLLLCGAIAWGCLGHINTTVVAAVVAEDDGAYCLVPEAALEAVVSNQEITIEGKTYTLVPDVLEPIAVSEEINVYVLLAGELKAGDVVYAINLKEKLDKGVYQGTIVTEILTPISFLLN